jgi:hypothetical protein
MKGPRTVLYETTDNTKDQNLSLKVPVKAQLTLSLMDKDSTIKIADAVLPFPDLQKTSFSFLFTMNSESMGQITGSISYLVPQSENINLYKKIPDLKEKLTYIVSEIQNWHYKSDSSVPKNIFDVIVQTLLYETDKGYKSDLPITSEKSTGAPDYLIKKINKNLEHLFFELYVGRPVIVTGKSKIAVEYAMATLDFLTPKKNLKKLIFSEDFIDPVTYVNKIDIFGISSAHEKKYKDYLVIDVDKFEIKGAKGKKTYFKKFMDDIIRIPASSAVQDIIKFIDHLDAQIAKLENILSESSDAETQVKEFLKGLSFDEANSLMEIASVLHPSTSKGIGQLVSSKMSSWIDELR